MDLIHLGDIAQGLKYIDGLSQTRFADQLAIARANFEPWLAIKRLRSRTIVSGTGAHEGGEGSAAEIVATVWQAQGMMHGLIDIDGLLIDVAHHGPGVGIREWTRGNVARLYLLDRLMSDDPPARVYLRAHRHEHVRVTVHRRQGTADLVVSPAYQLPSAYVRQVAQSPSAAICGMVALEVTDGRLTDVVPMLHKVDLRKRVTL